MASTTKSVRPTEQLGRLQSKNKKRGIGGRIKRYANFYVMFIPVLVILFLFYYLPMYGIKYAFTEFTPFGEPTWIGLDNFTKLFEAQRFWNAFNNTLFLSIINLVLSMVFSVGIALLMNEIGRVFIKKVVQTVIYLPHFLSWVVVAGIFTIILSQETGVVNLILEKMGFDRIDFLTNESWWRSIFFFINRWKETGWGTIIFIAALSGISPDLYEAAEIDGAGRLKQTWYITIPSLMNTILVVFILNLAKIMNIFESVFVLYNASVYNVADVIQTYTYRVGMQGTFNYGYSTAVGLFKSFVALILVGFSNIMSSKVTGKGIV